MVFNSKIGNESDIQKFIFKVICSARVYFHPNTKRINQSDNLASKLGVRIKSQYLRMTSPSQPLYNRPILLNFRWSITMNDTSPSVRSRFKPYYWQVFGPDGKFSILIQTVIRLVYFVYVLNTSSPIHTTFSPRINSKVLSFNNFYKLILFNHVL